MIKKKVLIFSVTLLSSAFLFHNLLAGESLRGGRSCGTCRYRTSQGCVRQFKRDGSGPNANCPLRQSSRSNYGRSLRRDGNGPRRDGSGPRGSGIGPRADCPNA